MKGETLSEGEIAAILRGIDEFSDDLANANILSSPLIWLGIWRVNTKHSRGLLSSRASHPC